MPRVPDLSGFGPPLGELVETLGPRILPPSVVPASGQQLALSLEDDGSRGAPAKSSTRPRRIGWANLLAARVSSLDRHESVGRARADAMTLRPRVLFLARPVIVAPLPASYGPRLMNDDVRGWMVCAPGCGDDGRPGFTGGDPTTTGATDGATADTGSASTVVDPTGSTSGRTSYDLVLLDLHMPDMDGFEACRAIRAMSGQYGTLPIIIWTASICALTNGALPVLPPMVRLASRSNPML